MPLCPIFEVRYTVGMLPPSLQRNLESRSLWIPARATPDCDPGLTRMTKRIKWRIFEAPY